LGSILKDDFSPATSDVDIIVDFSKPIGIEFIDLVEYFREIENEIRYVCRNTFHLIEDFIESGQKLLS